MLEDKCPTCPKYGTGKYCDCGSTGNPVGVGCALLVATAIICITLILIFG
tara:strand:+ start:14773 stop:14922 length:150 start_codon:yes stop_codon:yes gene_type:complete